MEVLSKFLLELLVRQILGQVEHLLVISKDQRVHFPIHKQRHNRIPVRYQRTVTFFLKYHL